jgi:His/Glu/Gln/Arg/opine family amino acid ABC transporter permease subunit
VSRDNDKLRAKINDALQKFVETGEWQRSFDRYLGESGYTPPPPPKIDRYEVRPAVAEPAGKIFEQYRGEILKAFWTTIKLAVYAAIGALILGTVLAAMRLSPVPMLRFLGAGYVTILRNTPLTLILLFCAFGLGQTLGATLAPARSATFVVDSGFRLAVLGLTVYTAAFVCESLRSGVNTVHIGQGEAARSLGLTFTQNLRLILLPQAFRSVIAPLGSVLIALTKNTTIASAIGVAEAAYLMKGMIENTAALLLVGSIFAAGFVVLTLPLGLLFTYLGRRLAVAR